MGKILLGIIVGVALAIGGFALYMDDPERATDEVDSSETISRGTDADETLSEDRSSGIRESGGGDVEESTSPDAITDRMNQSAELANEMPPEFPIPLPSEFSALLEGRAGSVHKSVERDAFDPDWAPAAELEVLNFISEHPEITATYGSPTVNCRTASCEVAFIAYGIDNSVRANAPDATYSADDYASIDFSRATSGFWARDGAVEQFGSPAPFAPVYMETENGVTTILWYLSRGVFE